MKKNILGIKIDDVSADQACKIVEGWLLRDGKHYIVTPNPEIIVMAQKDNQLKDSINKADLAIPDGVGLKLAGFLNSKSADIVNHIPGVDLMDRLIFMAAEKGFTVGLLGGEEGVAKKAAECLKEKYPKLKVNFAKSSGLVDNSGDMVTTYRLPTTNLLFVAFGPPKQEKWIRKNLPHLSVKVAMVVGGGFDYISGKVPRAPKFIRAIGFEWLFRLLIQPWRLKRQLALLKYIWLLTARSLYMLI